MPVNHQCIISRSSFYRFSFSFLLRCLYVCMCVCANTKKKNMFSI